MGGQLWWLYAIAVFLGAFVALGVLVFGVLWTDAVAKVKARKAGCICSFGLFVDWIQDDCPYHRAAKKEEARP